MSELAGIRNFLQLGGLLATSGMPRPEDFDTMRKAGFAVVVNLAMPTSDNAMANEGDLVTRAGMTYVHIPVNFEAPLPADFDRFSRMLDVLRGQKVYVHCAANMRVSAFVFLHRVLSDELPRAEAERDLRRIWNPDGVWRQFIDQRLSAAGKPPLT
jgi:protein tyrosine phosphatase (PTP) superfamily phosphohydrolase (DUF442 family)